MLEGAECGFEHSSVGREADVLARAPIGVPAAALTECVRAVLRSGPFPSGALVVLLVWAVAAPLAAARWFRWEE